MPTLPTSDGGPPAEDPTGIANLVVVDFVGPESLDSTGAGSFSATIANTGTAAATLPEAWLMTSLVEDFSSGFAEKPVTLADTSVDGDGVLEPGESAIFDLVGDFDRRFRLPILSGPVLAVKLRLNPDTSEIFDTPTGVLQPNRALLESDYSDNDSEVLMVGSPPGSCTPDALEENDSIEQAALIMPDTTYEIGNCDDTLDVFALDLPAGGRYEVLAGDDSYRLGGSVRMTVLAPDGSFVLQRTPVSGVFRTATAGRYIVVLHSISPYLYQEGSFEVRTQAQ